MKEQIGKITGLDLKNYIVSFKSCVFRNGGIIFETKFANASLDFSKFETSTNCSILFKRLDGNGKIIITCGENVISGSITSIVSQAENIEFSQSKTITIKRPNNCIGSVQLIEAQLFGENIPFESGVIMKDWHSILKTCTSYNQIKIVGGRLLASEGAKIIAPGINNIATFPGNCYKIDGNTIYFLYKCEILDLDVIAEPFESKQIYPHMAAPNTIPNIMSSQKNKQIDIIELIKNNRPLSSNNNINKNHILFDSSENDFFNCELNEPHAVKAQSGIKLDHRGKVSIPIFHGIVPNKNYMCIIQAQNLQGNGKTSVRIEPNNNSSAASMVVLPQQTKYINFVVSTNHPIEVHQNYNLIVERSAAATGHISLTRVILLEDQSINNILNVANQNIEKCSLNILSTSFVESFKISNDFFIVENDIIKARGEFQMSNNTDIKFAIVIPSYKNSEWVEKNLSSVLEQNNKNYRVIYIDDCSPDNTFEMAKKIVEKYNAADRVKLTRNDQRGGALNNLYYMIHSCDDNEVIITVDGDDWLAHEKVLDRLTEIYSDPNVWMTYGQYQSYPDNGAGCSMQIPAHIINHNAYRQYRWCSSHLRTFYAWLFKKIKKEDFLDKSGNFYPMAWDLSFMFPMLECGGHHAKFIPDILYIYNVANPINDSKVNVKLQQSLEREIRTKSKYDRL